VTISREVKNLLEGIGTPRPAPFKPDPFQLEALAMLEYEDVLVTAPTGSGKTWIAREEIRRLLGSGRRAWYTSPLKALTNSKYQEFIDEFGAERVGILTGGPEGELGCAADCRHNRDLSQSTLRLVTWRK
jgi:superfamily II RNA helicase